MTLEAKSARILYENLDTSFVNVWALLRYLSQRTFIGRVHVELHNYSADVFLNGREVPLVHEVDREAGTNVVEEAALHRLVLRVRESSGAITVYEGAEEAIPPQKSAPKSSQLAEPPVETEAATPEAMRSTAGQADDEMVLTTTAAIVQSPVDNAESVETLRLGGDLIGAVERAVTSLGVDFASVFRETSILLADDYPFLDPMAGQLRYEHSSLSLAGNSMPQGFVTAITEALRQVADRVATGEKARRSRERIALELSQVARKNPDALERSGFKEQLDRIAGTKVL